MEEEIGKGKVEEELNEELRLKKKLRRIFEEGELN